MIRWGLVVVAAGWVAGCLTPADAGSNASNDGGSGGGTAAAGGGTAGVATGGGFVPPRPNVLILLDKSGSMALPVDPSDPSCTAGCGSGGAACPPTCPTRIAALQAAIDAVFTSKGWLPRLGLAAFPNDAVCGQSSTPVDIRVPLASTPTDAPASLLAQAGLVTASVQRLSSGAAGVDLVAGGTPTAAALRQVGDLQQLQDTSRENFVLLITDGLPNCSASNPNTCLNPAACRCTVTSCGTTSAAQFCSLGCLADAETLAAVKALRLKNIKTIVFAVGPEAVSDVFSSLAIAGGFARACRSDADCGGADTCNAQTGFCRLPYLHGNSSPELQAELVKLFTPL